MPKSDDPIINKIPCECGFPNCDTGLLLRKSSRDKIKIQVFDKDFILTVIVSKDKLMKELEKLNA